MMPPLLSTEGLNHAAVVYELLPIGKPVGGLAAGAR
jgi:hypothetical protein